MQQAAVAACAQRLPSLRELVLQFRCFGHTAAGLHDVARLSQLEVLRIEGWEGDGRRGFGFPEGRSVVILDMTSRTLARLVAGKRALKHLCVPELYHNIPGALLVVGGACPQLEHLDLGRYSALNGLCRPAKVNARRYGSPIPLFPKIQSLKVARFSPQRLNRLLAFYVGYEDNRPDAETDAGVRQNSGGTLLTCG